MPVSPYMPDVRVEVAFTSGYGTPADQRVWTDVSRYVEAQDGVTITRGRADEASAVSASTLALSLDNSDGRFTAGRTSSPYWPNVKLGRPIRVRLAFPGNHVQNSGMETGSVGGWTGTGGASVAATTARAWEGGWAARITWPTASAGAAGVGTVTLADLIPGEVYTFGVWVYVPTGMPHVSARVASATGTASAVRNTWTQVSVTFTAATTSALVELTSAAATTSGNTVDYDGAMVAEGTSPATYTSQLTYFKDRFTGYVDEWPVEWNGGTDAEAVVKLAASSRMARLGDGTELRSVVEETTILAKPLAYYTLGEAEGSNRAWDTSGNGQPYLAKTVRTDAGGSTITFGNGTGPGTDGLPAVTFTGATASEWSSLVASAPLAGLTGVTNAWLSCWFTTTQDGLLAGISSDDFFNPQGFLGLSVTAGRVQADAGRVGGGTTTAQTSTTGYRDGLLHHAAIVVDGTTLRLYVDGVQRSTTPMPAGTMSPTVLVVGQVFNGTLAHVAVGTSTTTAATWADQYAAGATGFAGDNAEQRLRRYAAMVGIPAGEVTAEPGQRVQAHLDITGKSVLDAMATVENTEGGLLFDGKDGRLVFQARDHRYLATPDFVLSFDRQEVEEGYAAKLDRSGLVNDVTATVAGGDRTVRYQNAASVAAYGLARQSLELVTTDADAPLMRAGWLVNTHAEPFARVPDLTVDVLNLLSAPFGVDPFGYGSYGSAAFALWDADLGSRFSTVALPTQAATTTADYFVEGYTETIGATSYLMTLNVSPAELWRVFVLDDPTTGLLDTPSYPLGL